MYASIYLINYVLVIYVTISLYNYVNTYSFFSRAPK